MLTFQNKDKVPVIQRTIIAEINIVNENVNSLRFY